MHSTTKLSDTEMYGGIVRSRQQDELRLIKYLIRTENVLRATLTEDKRFINLLVQLREACKNRESTTRIERDIEVLLYDEYYLKMVDRVIKDLNKLGYDHKCKDTNYTHTFKYNRRDDSLEFDFEKFKFMKVNKNLSLQEREKELENGIITYNRRLKNMYIPTSML